jgi:hypothetical protein
MMSSHFNFDYDLVCIHLLFNTFPLPRRPFVFLPIACACLRSLHTLGPDGLRCASPKMNLELHIPSLARIHIVVEHNHHVATMAQRPERSTLLARDMKSGVQIQCCNIF